MLLPYFYTLDVPVLPLSQCKKSGCPFIPIPCLEHSPVRLELVRCGKPFTDSYLVIWQNQDHCPSCYHTEQSKGLIPDSVISALLLSYSPLLTFSPT